MRQLLSRLMNPTHDHVRADVEAGVHDPDAYLLLRLPARVESPVEIQGHLRNVADEAEARELDGDVRAARIKNPPSFLQAVARGVLLLLYFAVELWSLAQVLLAKGFAPAGAYGWAFVSATTLVSAVRGFTSATTRAARFWSAGALVLVYLTIGWVRADELGGDGAPVDGLVNGVLAIIATVGATIALHRLSADAQITGDRHRKLRETERHLRRMRKDVDASKHALIQAERAQQRHEAEERRLRAEYDRLHAIETARREARLRAEEELTNTN